MNVKYGMIKENILDQKYIQAYASHSEKNIESRIGK